MTFTRDVIGIVIRSSHLMQYILSIMFAFALFLVVFFSCGLAPGFRCLLLSRELCVRARDFLGGEVFVLGDGAGVLGGVVCEDSFGAGDVDIVEEIEGQGFGFFEVVVVVEEGVEFGFSSIEAVPPFISAFACLISKGAR